MKRRLFVLSTVISLLAWIVLIPSPILGQGNTWAGTSLAQMVEAARLRVGAFRVNASLTLTNAGYDTDVYYGYFDEAVPDFTLSAAVPVQVLLPLGKKIVLDLFESPQYLFYLDTRNERAWNNVFRGQIHFALKRFYLQAGGGLSNISQRLSPELNVNIRQKEDSLNGTLLWQASREISLAYIYGAAKYDFGDAEFGGASLAETLNRKENYFDFITYFQPSSRVRIFVDGQFGTYTFLEAASSFKDTRSLGVFGGFEFIPRQGETRQVSGLQGSIILGYKHFDIIAPQLADGSGLVGVVNISAGLLKRTMGRASFSQDFQFSVFSSATYYTLMIYGGGITHFLSKRASISYDLSFGRSTYPEAEMGGGVIPGGDTRYTTHLLSLDIRLSPDLRVAFLCTLGKRILIEGGPASNRNFFGFNLIYGFSAAQISAPVNGLSR